MSNLFNGMTTNDTLTTNGMLTNSTTSNHCVDLFFSIGALRGKNNQDTLMNNFIKAYNENKLIALKILFWVRDVREGAGERQIFKDIITYLANNDLNTLTNNIHLISEYGRWDDILPLLDTKAKDNVLTLIKEALKAKDGLCAKWLPRPNVNNKDKKRWANEIRKSLVLSPKQYRILLSDLSNTVEQLMCSNNWGSIEYKKVPSKAMSDYMSAFSKHDKERFSAFINDVKTGKTTIKAGVVYPYDIIKNMRYGNKDGADVQWNSLPNYMEGSKKRLLPIVDVSGSMSCSAGDSKSITCLDVAVSLGLYISERNEGLFKDGFVTFSTSPRLEILKGTLSERYMQMNSSNWSMSTNLEAVFNLVLNSAINNQVSVDEMPDTLVILSDMQFNQGVKYNTSAQEMIERMYNDAGYKMPSVIYWNLNGRNNNFPVKYDKSGVCLVSGFSPTLLKNILGDVDYSPEKIMLDIVNSDRYSKVSI
jgi:hypothetical protein